MNNYDVTITETLEKTVHMAAETQEEAERMVRQQYYNSEIVLDAEDFADVDFKTGEGRELLMDVLLVCPGEYPKKIQIDNTLENLQEAVDGNIESIMFHDDDACIICNEEGKLFDLPFNRALRDDGGGIRDILVGNFLVVGLGDDDFQSLSSEQMSRYEEMFHTPEVFVKAGRGWMSAPMDYETMKRFAELDGGENSLTSGGKTDAPDLSSAKKKKTQESER